MDEKSKVEFLEDYVEWANNGKMFPPRFTPSEYAEYLKHLKNEQILDKALNMVSDYEQSVQGWTYEMVAELARILRDEEK